jgi:hypothetical protein
MQELLGISTFISSTKDTLQPCRENVNNPRSVYADLHHPGLKIAILTTLGS